MNVDIREVPTEELLWQIGHAAAELSRRYDGTPLVYEVNKIWRTAANFRIIMEAENEKRMEKVPSNKHC